MDAAKTAVAHLQDNLSSRLGWLKRPAVQRIQMVDRMGFGAHGSQCGLNIPAQSVVITENHIGMLKRPRKLAAHGAQFHGIGAWFKYGQDTAGPAARFIVQAVNGGADGRRMVGKIIVNGELLTVPSAPYGV